MLGNGQIIDNLVAQGTVTFGGQTETGSILLDETSVDILVGMAFLRQFKLALIVTDTSIILHDKEETRETIIKFMETAPIGLPNTEPGSF